jgi:uncharacterized YkwD family protein
MKNQFIKITLILSLLFVMAVPAQAFAAEKSCSLNKVKIYNTNYCKTYSSIPQDIIKQIQNKISQLNKKNIDCSQLQNLLKAIEQRGSKAPAKPEAPAAPKAPAKPEAPAVPAKPEAPTTPAKPETPAQNPAPSLGDYEQQVVNLVNKERAAVGLPALKVNNKLAGVAEKKAEDLRNKNYFAHNSPTYGSPFDMMKQFGITYTAAGENIAKGQKTPEAVMNGWMNSPGHRANILNSSFTEIGVGYVTDSNGTTYWVQMFIRP